MLLTWHTGKAALSGGGALNLARPRGQPRERCVLLGHRIANSSDLLPLCPRDCPQDSRALPLCSPGVSLVYRSRVPHMGNDSRKDSKRIFEHLAPQAVTLHSWDSGHSRSVGSNRVSLLASGPCLSRAVPGPSKLKARCWIEVTSQGRVRLGGLWVTFSGKTSSHCGPPSRLLRPLHGR